MPLAALPKKAVCRVLKSSTSSVFVCVIGVLIVFVLARDTWNGRMSFSATIDDQQAEVKNNVRYQLVGR